MSSYSCLRFFNKENFMFEKCIPIIKTIYEDLRDYVANAPSKELYNQTTPNYEFVGYTDKEIAPEDIVKKCMNGILVRNPDKYLTEHKENVSGLTVLYEDGKPYDINGFWYDINSVNCLYNSVNEKLSELREKYYKIKELKNSIDYYKLTDEQKEDLNGDIDYYFEDIQEYEMKLDACNFLIHYLDLVSCEDDIYTSINDIKFFLYLD